MKKQNGPDISGLMTRIQEQITALDRKVDVLMSRCAPCPAETRPVPPSLQPQVQGNSRPLEQRPARPMFPATCSDCKRSCEIPFKPSGERPVYCKECFSRRKVAGAVKVVPDHKPNEMPIHLQVVSAAPEVSQVPAPRKKKPVAVKKPAVKKKPVAKKKK